ncbi:MAG: sulfate ABC transporter substrate-binding protein [Fimbriiglobus sp.]|jgi:sulfate transport system substrate-binding protein|nr:sulfate ABC transporter substrate-binding protein [Fimbriiglobus sp.]
MIRKLLALMIAGWLLFAAVWVVASGFTRNEVMLNAACDPTRELWRDLNATFIADHERTTGIKLAIRQSHGGSGSQARAVIDGLPADVVTLALFTDTDQLRKAGLIEPGWEGDLPNRSLPYTSTIVFVVRKGNPKGVRDWPDLLKDGVSVITPNPKTSGNGKWSFLALWGSVMWRGGTEAEAERYVGEVFRRVPVLDPSARGATLTFAQKGIGDVHLTWENEAHLEVQEANGELEIVYPPISVRAEPHVAVVDQVVDRKGTRAEAEAYLQFLFTEPAQEVIAHHYHRPTNPAVLERWKHQFPDLRMEAATTLVPSGRWDDVQKRFFAEGAMFDRLPLSGGNR